MVSQRTPFDPKVNGFKFVNYFEFPQPLKINLPLIGSSPINANDIVFGLCGGMTFAALDYFNHQITPPVYNNPGDINVTLYHYLINRQLDSLGIGILQKMFAMMIQDDDDLGVKIANNEVPNLRSLIDSGKPASLALIRVSGLNDPTRNHQVAAVGYDFDPDTHAMSIYLYDPNHPGDEPVITLDLSNPQGGVHLAQSTGEPLHAFFVTNYSAENPPQ